MKIPTRNFVYPARLTAGRKDLTVQFVDLPEGITSGEDRAEALAQAADCLEEAIANRIDEGMEIPPPSPTRRGQTPVALPASMAAKAALYVAIKEAGQSQTHLARRLNLDEREIRRLLDPRHQTRLARIQQVLSLLGKRLIVGIEDAV